MVVTNSIAPGISDILPLEGLLYNNNTKNPTLNLGTRPLTNNGTCIRQSKDLTGHSEDLIGQSKYSTGYIKEVPTSLK